MTQLSLKKDRPSRNQPRISTGNSMNSRLLRKRTGGHSSSKLSRSSTTSLPKSKLIFPSITNPIMTSTLKSTRRPSFQSSPMSSTSHSGQLTHFSTTRLMILQLLLPTPATTLLTSLRKRLLLLELPWLPYSQPLLQDSRSLPMPRLMLSEMKGMLELKFSMLIERSSKLLLQLLPRTLRNKSIS